MTISPLAGKPAPAEVLIDPDKLCAEYYARRPDPAELLPTLDHLLRIRAE